MVRKVSRRKLAAVANGEARVPKRERALTSYLRLVRQPGLIRRLAYR